MAIGLIIAGVIAFAVGKDAAKRGMNAGLWGVGVFLLLIVFLPLYFIVRKPVVPAYGAPWPQPAGAPGAYPPQPAGAQGAYPQLQPAAAPGLFPPGTAVMVVAVDGQRYQATVNQFQNGQYLCSFSNGSQSWFHAQSVSI